MVTEHEQDYQRLSPTLHTRQRRVLKPRLLVAGAGAPPSSEEVSPDENHSGQGEACKSGSGEALPDQMTKPAGHDPTVFAENGS